MAFVFRTIEQQLQNQQGNNIFGEPNQQADQGGAVQLSSTQGAQSGGQGGQSSGQNQNVVKQQQQQPASNAALFNQIKQKNKVDAGNVGYVKEATQSAGNIQQNLQQQANEIAARPINTPSISDEEFQRATKQGGQDFEKIKQLFAQQAVVPQDVNLDVDTRIKNLPELQTEATRRALAQREYGPQYTTGMSSLDDAMLRRNSDFQNIIKNLKSQQSSLESEKSAKQAELQKQADEKYTTGVTSEQERVRRALEGSVEGIRGDIRTQSQTARDDAQKLQDEDRSWLEGYAGEVRKKLAEMERQKLLGNLYRQQPVASPDGRAVVDWDTSDAKKFGEWQSQVQALKDRPWQEFDPGGFSEKNLFNTLGQYGSYDTVINPEQAQEFNNIMALLGQDKNMKATPTESKIRRLDKQGAEKIGEDFIKDYQRKQIEKEQAAAAKIAAEKAEKFKKVTPVPKLIKRMR